MAKAPWITIIGLGEDGLDGLPPASRCALDSAEIVMGPRRHLDLVRDVPGQVVEWPVPFADGIALLRSYQGQSVAVLASGDPFWFGAGGVIARNFDQAEWVCLPGPSVFSL
ncbi:MAG: cobalt-precorrin-7 (C(5))-methyltransferase, partial [Pseudomonadota bacterium]